MTHIHLRLFGTGALCFLPWLFFAQALTISGTVVSERTGEVLPDAAVSAQLKRVITEADGSFSLELEEPQKRLVLFVEKPGYVSVSMPLDASGKRTLDLGRIELQGRDGAGQFSEEDLIPIITLSVDEQLSAGAQNISGLLTASRDVFVSAAAFTFGPNRFRIRGYGSEDTEVLLNGMPVNDLESGRVFWSNWGGLNDVLRNRTNTVGLQSTEYALGGVGGATFLDLRASRQRKQLRVSYALSNRTYDHRLMATWKTGMLQNGWAVSLSASRRWAQQGFIPGTFYDAWSYFLSVDKKLGDKHLLNLVAFGAPITRGRATASVQEMYDLAGTNYYNSWWGFQNGEKRNSRVGRTHQPVVMLRHDWEVNKLATLTTSLGYQWGRHGSTALDWYDARDPRPDYYRKLPSWIEDVDPEQAARVADILRSSEEARQIDWARMYTVNRNSLQTIRDANGIPGNDITGLRSQYIVEDRRFDPERANFSTFLRIRPTAQVNYTLGLSYQYMKTHAFKTVEDLLGGEFYVDIDKFAEFDSTGNNDFIQNDLDTPNKILREGDVWGYDYETRIHRARIWGQGEWATRHWEFFLGGSLGNVNFFRRGNVRNGKFPDHSQGDSETQSFMEYQAKGGITYKINGRNYLLANAMVQARAPFAREAFISPRTRNEPLPNLTTAKILSVEAGYLLQAPYAKARVLGYFTTFRDQIWNRSFYLDNAIQGPNGQRGGFVNYIMQGIDTRHMGLELAGEVQVLPGLRLQGVAALGQYLYTNRPTVSIFLDNVAQDLGSETAYLKNFRVAGTPQMAYTFGIHYNAPQYWFANLNFNYFDQVWIDFNPARRTVSAVANVPGDPEFEEQAVNPGSELWNRIIEKEKAPGAFTMDFFGGKSFKFNDVFLYLTVGVNNILDKRDFITGGYEQLRFDFEGKDVDRFPSQYFYALGRNYFISVALRI